MNKQLPYDGRKAYELSQKATEFLANAGVDMWGKEKSSENYHQGRFEQGMRTGAFSRNGDSRGSKRG